MASELVTIADEVAAYLAGLWQPTAPDAVERVWAKQIGLDPDSPYPLLTGRQVFVIPGSTEQVEVMNRSAQRYRYTVGVLVCERYTDGPGDVPADWVDERVAFVEQSVFGPLADPRLAFASGTVRAEIDGSQRVDVPVDREVLLSKRAFWCPMAFSFIVVS